jgi:signal peptidase II
MFLKTSSSKAKLKIIAVLVPLVFLADQGTKWLVKRSLNIGDSISVVRGLFDIVHVRNRGAAFGFMAQLPESVRLPFFYAVSAVALGLITVYLFRMKDGRRSIAVCLALILGGACGNIWDRIRLGEVVDFLSFHWYNTVARIPLGSRTLVFRLEWPAFNVADSAISVAVVWLMLLLMKETKEPKA